jgi:hypothetical protein
MISSLSRGAVHGAKKSSKVKGMDDRLMTIKQLASYLKLNEGPS